MEEKDDVAAARQASGNGSGLTSERLRQVKHLRASLLDTLQEIEQTAREAEKTLPPGAVPGLIRTGYDWVNSALEIVDATLAAAEGKERSDHE